MQIDGQCHCGAIRYTAQIDPERISICHCADCQTLTGSPFRVTALCARRDIQIAGVSTIYVKAGDSGRKRQMHFCGACGTPLFACADGDEGDWGIRWGSIRQRDALTPKRQIWCRSAVPWIAKVPALPDGGNP